MAGVAKGIGRIILAREEVAALQVSLSSVVVVVVVVVVVGLLDHERGGFMMIMEIRWQGLVIVISPLRPGVDLVLIHCLDPFFPVSLQEASRKIFGNLPMSPGRSGG